METAVVGGAAGLLALVCVAASALPARRAVSVALLGALREE
jgi:ABC-type lipoprotein release transport system permease subunit